MTPRLAWGSLALVTLAAGMFAGPRDAQWREVDESAKKGLPQTAIEELKPIIAGALADKAYAEAIKAIGRKVALEGVIQGNKPEEKIFRLQAELDRAPAEMKPVMEALLAHYYWQYFVHNRWRFLQRTQTATVPGPDFQTWDLGRILTEIDRHFSVALANPTALQATPIDEYDDLLEKGSVPDNYRPTIYDFLAHEASAFYQAGEQAAVASEDEFEVSAAGPIFADASAFANWRPPASIGFSPQLNAIRLYQALLTFHQSDADRSAFYDADLARITYGYNIAVGDDKGARYKAALQSFIEATAKHEISARALDALAVQLFAEGEPAQAHELALQGLNAFPASVGGAMCFNLIHRIEAKSAQLETEHVWNAPWPLVNVTYRNITKVHFRAIAVNFADHLKASNWNTSVVSGAERVELLAASPTLEWESALPATTDYKERSEKLPVPHSLKSGFYMILASPDTAFGETDNPVGIAPVWVSDLALVLRMRFDGRKNNGLVLKANSGEPVAGARIRLWQRDREGQLNSIAPTLTDTNGWFELPPNEQRLVVLAEDGDQAISSINEISSFGGPWADRPGSQTVFFTDRAIYRPGQTINYKAVSVRFNQASGLYTADAGVDLTVEFVDANGQVIVRATQRTNDYGSISGVFTAPRDRLTGRMMIRVAKGRGFATFAVEEYKRPKFQAELDPPREAAKLNSAVTVPGKAIAYTGAALGGAKVKWRVERGVQCPSWCWWWQPPFIKAIGHGTAVTEPDGTFKIQFFAESDPAVPAKNEPTFIFTVHVDVTDTTGETRSVSRSVSAGYTALQVALQADDWQTPDQPVKFAISTNSLNGDPQAAKGLVAIYALKQPSAVQRLPLRPERNWWAANAGEPATDQANPDTWELGAIVAQKAFETNQTGKASVCAALPAGIYRALLETEDRFGRKVTGRQTVEVVDPRAQHLNVKVPNRFAAPQWKAAPGETFHASWGTGYSQGRAFVEVECNGKTLKSYWTAPDRTNELMEVPVTESMRGGFTVRTTFVRENRAYLNQHVVDVPWSDKELAIRWESFRSKLASGQKETWSASVTGPDAKRTVAEMVAVLYDASLDQFLPNEWPKAFNVLRREGGRGLARFENSDDEFQNFRGWAPPEKRPVDWRYRGFPAEIVDNPWEPGSGGVWGTGTYGAVEDSVVLSPFAVEAEAGGVGYRANDTLAGTRIRTALNDVAESVSVVSRQFLKDSGGKNDKDVLNYSPEPDLSTVSARRNLNETAFFYPQLLADRDGVVKMVFTVPEALTQWKFLGFAHDKQLRAGFLTGTTVTTKDLMVEPNPPRFLREGDVVEFAVKVSNQTDHPQVGTVRLTFADAASQKPVDQALENQMADQSFELPPMQSRSYTWRIAVPDSQGFISYKAVAASAQFSDGEEGFLPILSRRILVTESLALPIRGKSTKPFEFRKLLESGSSDSLRHESLTVQMATQPAWYAVMALPYLMEYPYECSEQVFNRLYANALARHIASSDPKVRRIFELWRNTPALDSPLEKNQDLKSVMLEETPWLREARTESEARRNVGVLFDANRLDEETSRASHTLAESQLRDGLWSWFPGGSQSEYISLYITAGFGRLRHLGVEVDLKPALKSLEALDAWMDDNYRRIRERAKPEDYIPSYTDALYLYGRSFFLDNHPVAAQHREAVDFYLHQSRKFWLQVNCRQSQAQVALALQRFGDTDTPQAIMKSLKERSIHDEELGMYWRDSGQSWWWYHAPIETQAMMIEALAEVTHDAQAVEDCQVWLLKQKQTQDWKTTKATADAIYALLLRGNNLLASDAPVEVSLGGNPVKPEKIEAGTGFFEQRFVRNEIRPSMGEVTVKKVDDGVSWGSIHWQYLEDIGKISLSAESPLTVSKALFVKETSGKGQVLRPVTGPVAVGDELVVRIELRTDRDLEFVHLKDQHGSGTEPVDVLSRYKFQDGLGYYEATHDTATHFFIDYLPKGVYVFEYSTRVQLKGRYQTGLAEVQCMYAPEFNSHSESIALEVK